MNGNRLKSVLARLLQFLAVTAGIFAWWMAMFLLVSLFAMSIWSPKWTDLVRWSLLLTAVCSLIWLIMIIRRARR